MVLAAGASSRMRGEDKLLREIDGTPLILRAVRAACAASPSVVVVLPVGSARAAWLADMPAHRIEVGKRAMSVSIAAGVVACPLGAVMLHLADMPAIGADDLAALCEAWQAMDVPVLRAATADGRAGHPIVFAEELRPALSALQGDEGARSILVNLAVELHVLRGDRAVIDLDTPEDWERWSRERARLA